LTVFARGATAASLAKRNVLRRFSTGPDGISTPFRLTGFSNHRGGFSASAQRTDKGLLRMSDTLERVRKIVIEHLDADPEKVTEKASFIDDLGADSLDNVELVMAFEEEFDIEIPDDAAEHIQTVGDAVKFIDERLGA
jgi:acyl carrier protein